MQEPTWEAVRQRLDHLEHELAKWKQADHWRKRTGLAAVAMLRRVALLEGTKCIELQQPSKARKKDPANLPIDGALGSPLLLRRRADWSPASGAL